MLSFVTSVVLGAAAIASATTTIPNTSTATSDIAQELATSVPQSPVSHVKGKVFDRFVNIMMENTDFPLAASDPNMIALAAKGITLTNYYGITHPSEPNYCAIYGGDNFGMDNDAFNQIPANVSNIWDLLADKAISFSEYQEDIPYPGFEGLQYLDPQSGANNYVRKHNPAVLFNSNAARFDYIKSFEALQADVNASTLAQHIFITPNMLNDAHDTGITYGAEFLLAFLEPLLKNPVFMNNTLLLINFDETGTYAHSNEVFSILISDTMPSNLIGTTDDTVYTHYSALSTVEANWGLDTLGRWDVGANVFKYVAEVTGDVIREPEVPVGEFFFNSSYAGAFATTLLAPMPVPNTELVVNGRKVFKDVVAQWSGLQECTYYEDVVLAADGMRPPKEIPASCATLSPAPLTSSTSSSSSISASTTSSSSSSSSVVTTTSSSSSTPTATSTSSSVIYSNGTTSASSSSTQYTTSTVRTTYTSTIYSCAPTVTNCPYNQVTTVTVDLYTTVCPVTATQTSASVIPAQTTYTTTCASPTTLTVGTNTYTVTASTVLTVTDCSCTHTTGASTSVIKGSAPVSSAAGVASSSIAVTYPVSSAAGVVSSSAIVTVKYESTTPAPTLPITTSKAAVGTGTLPTTSTIPFTGAAAFAGSQWTVVAYVAMAFAALF